MLLLVMTRLLLRLIEEAMVTPATALLAIVRDAAEAPLSKVRVLPALIVSVCPAPLELALSPRVKALTLTPPEGSDIAWLAVTLTLKLAESLEVEG
jgi:hypothetical protein